MRHEAGQLYSLECSRREAHQQSQTSWRSLSCGCLNRGSCSRSFTWAICACAGWMWADYATEVEVRWDGESGQREIKLALAVARCGCRASRLICVRNTLNSCIFVYLDPSTRPATQRLAHCGNVLQPWETKASSDRAHSWETSPCITNATVSCEVLICSPVGEHNQLSTKRRCSRVQLIRLHEPASLPS